MLRITSHAIRVVATRTVGALALLALSAAVATGQTADPHDHAVRAPASGLDAALRAIDTLPTRAQLEAAVTNPVAGLADAALDDSRPRYERERAITLLSLFDAAQSRPVLEALAAYDDADIRTMATYTLVRAFQAEVGADWVPHLEEIARTADDREAEYAVRALRWVDAPAADGALARLAASGGERGELAATIRQRRLERGAPSASGPTTGPEEPTL